VTTTQSNLAGLSRYIFRVPRWYASLALSLTLAALTGIVAFDSAYPLDDAWRGVFFVGLPTVAASLLTVPVDRALGGRLTNDRASLLALVCELLIIAVLLVAGLLSGLLGFTQEFVLDALLVALAAVFALRLLVILAVSNRHPLRAMIPASIQTVAAAVLLFVYSGTLYYLQVGGPFLQTFFARPEHTALELQYSIYPFDFVLLGITCLVHATAALVFLAIVDRPWRSSLDVSVLDFIQGFIGHLAEDSRELEGFFENIGEEAVVPVTVLSFRRPEGEEKARFVLPMIHPGPMGDIGGGNLPVQLAKATDALSFAPHATAGHDFNLVTEREVDRVCAAADRALQQVEYTATATSGVRTTEGDATLTGHAFGDDALLVNSFAPTCADDIEYAVGLAAASEARTSGLEDVLLVDAHNCNDGLEGGDLGHVAPGSQRSFDLIAGAGRLGERLVGLDQQPLRLGTAWDETPWGPAEGIGPLGIRVALLEAGDDLTAYVLVDGNNMEPGLREQLLGSLDGVDTAEVMTSDTHVVNTVEAENQVGADLPEDELIDLVQSLVDSAIDDLEPVEAGMATERTEVTVFGNDRTETLASHANAMVPMATGLAAASVVGVLAISILIFLIAENLPL
jgi:putative membrane protein